MKNISKLQPYNSEIKSKLINYEISQFNHQIQDQDKIEKQYCKQFHPNIRHRKRRDSASVSKKKKKRNDNKLEQ